MDEPELPLSFVPPLDPPVAPISDLVRFGTSTWTYEGWQGQVYQRTYSKTTFPRECLGEFCQYLYNGQPLFRTVGNDATFYRLICCKHAQPGKRVDLIIHKELATRRTLHPSSQEFTRGGVQLRGC